MTSMPFNLIGLAKPTESRQQEARNKIASQGGDDFAALLRQKADNNRWQSLVPADTRSASWRRSNYDAGMTAWRNDASEPQPKRPSTPSDRQTAGTDRLHDRRDDRPATAQTKPTDSARAGEDKGSKDTAKTRKDTGKADDDATSDTATAATDGKQQAADSNNVHHHSKQDDASDHQTGQQQQGQEQPPAQDGQAADGQAAGGQVANDQAANGQPVGGVVTVAALPVSNLAVTTADPASAPKAGATASLAASSGPAAGGPGASDQADQQIALSPGFPPDLEIDLPENALPADGKTKPGSTTTPSGTITLVDDGATQDQLAINQILVPVGKPANASSSITDDNPLTAGPRKGLAEKGSQRDPAKIDTVRAPQAVVQSTQSQPQPSAAPMGQDSDLGGRADFGNGDFGGFDNGTGNYGGFGTWPMSPMLTASPSKQADFIAALKQQLGNMPLQEQVAVHMQRAARDGVDKISIQLSPEELGRIHVKMDIDDDKKVRATVTVERPATLDLLQRDSRALERALHEAGLKTDSGSLSFNLQRGNTGDFSGSGDWGQGGRQSSRTSGQAGVAGPADRITAASAPEIDTANGLVDVEV
ncbi:flagellar hook-length control protein FliK [Dongia soli]|uniref:Flagellar hook-length control protein FliK n=1 Tax=Dongia soli TaxID=600628 RepID=A0ABU5E8J0_9PROT|nr:flagellar hook-length control protein FliK [Dongia soli]MDY0882643.1 flagellar hook-length control protein FliK [Dongia soli]